MRRSFRPCPPSSSNRVRLDKGRLKPGELVGGNVAGDAMVPVSLHGRRRLVADGADATGTTGGEGTAAWDLVSTGHPAFEQDACDGVVRVGNRHGGEQRLGIRVVRRRE